MATLDALGGCRAWGSRELQRKTMSAKKAELLGDRVGAQRDCSKGVAEPPWGNRDLSSL